MIELGSNNVMVDLETLGTATNSVILSLGACVFDERGVSNTFYRVINTDDCKLHGMSINMQTLDWWMQQAPEARVVLTQAINGGGELCETLDAFAQWLREIGVHAIWSNGAAFDIAMLEYAYCKTNRPIPWRHTQQMCFRTLRSLHGAGVPWEHTGVAHNALDDAISQAKHAIKIFRSTRTLMPAIPATIWNGYLPPPLEVSDGGNAD